MMTTAASTMTRCWIATDDQHQGHGDDQLVGDRIEKSAERSGLTEAARQIAIERIGDGGGGEQQAGGRSAAPADCACP